MFNQYSASTQYQIPDHQMASSSFRHHFYWLTLFYLWQRRYPRDMFRPGAQQRYLPVVAMTRESSSLAKRLFPSRLPQRRQALATKSVLAFLHQLRVQRRKQNSCTYKCFCHGLNCTRNTTEWNQHIPRLCWQSSP